jgi:hypothetical protein
LTYSIATLSAPTAASQYLMPRVLNAARLKASYLPATYVE